MRHCPGDGAFGRLGERLAERHLSRCGWRILGRRVRTARGEIDLLGEDPAGALAVIEVKSGRLESWPASIGDGGGLHPLLRPARRFGPRDFVRRRRAATDLARQLRRGPVRVDLVEVLTSPTGKHRVLHHWDIRGPVLWPAAFGPEFDR